MPASRKRSLRDFAGNLGARKLQSKQRLVAYRAQAVVLASQRVDRLQQLFGPQLQCYTAISFHESVYYMARQRWNRPKETYRWLMHVSSLAYCISSLAAFYSLLLAGSHVLPFATRYAAHLAIAVFIVLAILSIFATRGFIGLFRAELSGFGDGIRSGDLRRFLYYLTIGSGIYFFGVGIALSWLNDRQPATPVDALEAALELFIGALGALGLSICFATWLYITVMSSLNRSASRTLAERFPIEVALHEIISSACLLRSSRSRKLSLRLQRNWDQHIELAARAVELGLRKQLLVSDRFSSDQITSRLSGIANGFRDLKIWLATPRPDTYDHLNQRLVAMINHVAAGNWDLLPTSSRPLSGKHLIQDALVVVLMTILAVGLSGSFAWLAGLLFKTSNAFVPSFGAILPVITTYLFGLVVPELSTRRLAGK